jgi:hypothetical protein
MGLAARALGAGDMMEKLLGSLAVNDYKAKALLSYAPKTGMLEQLRKCSEFQGS